MDGCDRKTAAASPPSVYTDPMLLRAILAFLALPAMVGGAVPWLISMIPAPALFRSAFGLIPLLAGSLILVL